MENTNEVNEVNEVNKVVVEAFNNIAQKFQINRVNIECTKTLTNLKSLKDYGFTAFSVGYINDSPSKYSPFEGEPYAYVTCETSVANISAMFIVALRELKKIEIAEVNYEVEGEEGEEKANVK